MATWWKKIAAVITNDGYRRNQLEGFSTALAMMDGQERANQG